MADEQGMFRTAMEKSFLQSNQEKNKFDRLMGRDEMQRLKAIFTKPILTNEDVNEMQNTIIATEIKLTDFRGRERYINHKFYIVIGEYATRYTKAIRADEQYQKEMKEYKKQINDADFSLEVKEEKLLSLAKVEKVRAEIQKDYAGMYKKMVNAYLYGVRSALSSEGNLINLLGTDRKEYSYEGNLSPVPQSQQQQPQPPQQQGGA